MNILSKPLFILLSTLLLISSLSSNGQYLSPINTDHKLKNQLDTIVNCSVVDYLSNNNTFSVSIGIYIKGHKTTYTYSREKLPNADNYYNIGSVAKTFVGALLAQAVLDKKINLDDDIRKYLPGGYSNLQYRGHGIRVKHLANHTSALPKTFRSLPTKVVDSLRGLTIPEQVDYLGKYSRDDLLDDLRKVKPDTVPGTKFSYNSTAVMVLIALLESSYKDSYEHLISAYMKGHLGMHYTTPYLDESQINDVVQGHDNKGQPVPFANLSGFYFGPTMNSTINDMLIYIEANLKLNDRALGLTHQLTYGKDDGFGMGLGWMINRDERGVRYFYHDGNTKIGYNTLCVLYPTDDYGIVIMVNDTIDQRKVSELKNDIRHQLLLYDRRQVQPSSSAEKKD
ncbi:MULTISPECIES: serine hydrolase domain-containing protein [Sphingobacterium]|uniref:Beta-lactamase n=1 Tax=Sphingobacterium multivorum TaxID=28454 RepID=A0A654DLH1_SPHMU|nr:MULTISPECIES: serine hydrolase domain-containing protein [Sphingobacterium]QQT45643.1 beta-lactamase family protein [Sphingobacterium multivorum]SUJ27695.1 Beta-lactamase [Sphingobacterium multivorum]VXD05224.1 Beta-lactamase [Sphingobacterium multivorum]